MQWRNQKNHWGLTAILLHWLVAAIIISLFNLGWWMTGLDYYDPWYKQGPDVHRSIGLILFLIVLFRISWRLIDSPPAAQKTHARWEQQLAAITHRVLYLLLFIIMISGYLISTADGRDISVFGWFDVPALGVSFEEQEDISGAIHWYTACTLIAFVCLHALGALKHQFVDKDGTLSRMLGS